MGAARFIAIPRRGGGILLELMVALAIFAGAAAFALASVRSVFTALDQSRREQALVDLARSKMAELEAGIITLADLRSDDGSGGTADASANDVLNSRQRSSPFTIDVQTSRSEFTDLVLVELTVAEPVSATADVEPLQFTLRQLVPIKVGGST